MPQEHADPKTKVPALPLKSVVRLPDDGTGKTPTLTPHTLTDIALKKSELLLAEMTAMGLLDEEDVGKKHVEAADNAADDAFCLDLACQTPTGDSTARQSELKLGETVEVPVVLLNLFSETLTKFSNSLKLGSLSSPTKKDAEVNESEPEAEDLSSPSSTTAYEDSTHCSTTPNTSLFSPREPASPCSSTAKFAEPPRMKSAAPPGRKSLPAAQSTLQFHQQLSPRIQGGSMRIPNVTSRVRLEAPLGCKSCTLQQTVTVTNTVHFHM